MTTIAIIGTGRMARGLGTGWARAGHRIIFGSRVPDEKIDLIAAIPHARVTTRTDALNDAAIAVITLPYPEVAPFCRAHADVLRERLVIDISNPFDHLPDNRVAGAEITRDAIGSGARVVAAFKTTFAATLLEPLNTDGVQRDVLFAGDDEDDKRIVAGLIADLGFRPVDCGVLHNARILDGMVPLIIELDRRYGGTWQTSWKLLP
ncbi:MAG: NAD(P)-binding domain-containing protein [Roseiflexaceae bacterium]|nr:NAD(P)-binding domain-containing protein [Roseiflexus sp.]MDW8213113.1 NAD(P)-binding domain-containing protein [Roseiflexaceae bacterium]